MKWLEPDGWKEGTPYWVLPSDRITYSMSEAISAREEYYDSLNKIKH